jgi:hypothetical protein
VEPPTIETTPSSTASTPAIRAAAGVFAGFALLAVVNAIAVAILVPLPRAGVGLRVAHHVFDAAETLGVGALAAAAVGVFTRFVRLPRWATVIVCAAAATALVYPGLDDAFRRQASFTLRGRFMDALFVLFFVVSGLAIPAAHRAGTFFARRPRLRFAPLAFALIVMIGDHRVIPDDYFGIHACVAWAAATLSGASLAPLAERAFRALARVRPGRVALAATAAFALFGLAYPPGNAVRFELFRQPCAIAPWLLAATLWRAPRPRSPAPPSSPWYEDRSARPGVPPTSPPLVPEGPVVVLITVDALRGDVVNDPQNDALLPMLTEMKARGAYFPRASSPASQTTLSLTALFSGRYFSELVWGQHGRGLNRFTFAADDPSPRFPQILSDHGVDTAIWATLITLGADYGVARGFRDHQVLVKGTEYANAPQAVNPLIARLRRAGSEPLFLYTHLMEPHGPYNRGKKRGTARERYLSEVAVADGHLRRVVKVLTERFADRWVLFVSADHGEAFGEHQTIEHSKTLYQELVHVPLLAFGPRIAPRTIDQRVGLVDLGPTILDLFGVETPATFEGQSLVPLLAGKEVTLTRPIIAEGRLRRALTLPDGRKVIEDPRRKVVEVYDLAADPGETQNLFELDPARADPAFAALRAFFAVHEVKKEGYERPFEP